MDFSNKSSLTRRNPPYVYFTFVFYLYEQIIYSLFSSRDGSESSRKFGIGRKDNKDNNQHHHSWNIQGLYSENDLQKGTRNIHLGDTGPEETLIFSSM